MDIMRGTLRAYDPATHTASVEIWGEGYSYLEDLPVSQGIPPVECIDGADCGVVFFNPTDQTDACIAFLFGTTPTPDVVLANGNSQSSYVAAQTAVYETDTTLTVTITPAVTSTIVAIVIAKINSTAARAGAFRLGLLLDAAAAGQTLNEGISVANTPVMAQTAGVWTGQSAAGHTIKLQLYRVNGADTVTAVERTIVAFAIPE